MKKILLLLFALITVVAKAQIHNLNREFNVTNTAFAMCETEDLQKDLVTFKDGVKWHLENSPIGDKNYVRFWIETPDGEKLKRQTWNGDNIKVFLNVNEKGKKSFLVGDDLFLHLRIMEFDFGWVVHLCSVLAKE